MASRMLEVWQSSLKNVLKYKIYNIHKDNNGRMLVLDIMIENTRYTIANCYAPNEDDADYFHLLFQKIEACNNDFKIIGGDFNILLEQEDKRGGNGITHPKSTKFINEYMQQHYLVDIWRALNPDSFRFTWQRKLPSPILERLDFFLISSAIHQYVTIAEIYPAFKSDHSIPSVYFSDLIPDAQGKGYWKMNTHFLDNAEYKE